MEVMMESNKGWKVFDSELRCRGYQYEVGKTYTHEGSIGLCVEGFHFHTKPIDLFNYYSFDPDSRVCGVVWSGAVEHGDDKSVTDTLEIVRELSWHEVLDLVNIGKGNAGRNNSGNRNSGYRNSGNRNSGDWNSGNNNSGNRNSGYRNSGNRNSGNNNSGNNNSGDWNSGNNNSGDWNSGNNNSGDWNSANCSSGYLCTEEPKVLIFDKETELKRDEICFPDYFYFNLTLWIYSEGMSDEEKEQHPEHEAAEGYLKTLGYHEAWRRSWGNTSDEDRRKTLELPNWNNAKFLEISGIDVEKELGL
jgi:hypothetical protein